MSTCLPILAFDTTAQQCAVALLTSSRAHERTEPQARGQSERLLPMIREVMAEGGLALGDLAGLVVTTGPGSFTGLRVGLAAAHGITLATDVPAIGIDSFAAFNAGISPGGGRNRAVVVESRRAELYWSIMTENGEMVSPPACDLPVDIVRTLGGQTVLLCGDGCVHLAALLPHLTIVDQRPGPDMLALARLGAESLSRGPPASAPLPLYIRPPDAKVTGG